jgi:hypothetical protein
VDCRSIIAANHGTRSGFKTGPVRNSLLVGGTTADTLSAILKDDPPELPQTSLRTSPALDRIVADA